MAESKVPRNRLRELRDRSRLTQEEVSLVTGYSVAAISRHENSSRGMTQEAIEKYASLYKVHTFEIFVDPGEVAGHAAD